MYDPTAPSSVLALTELRKPGVFGRLRGLALRRSLEEQAADALVSDSLLRVFDPEDMPWLPARRPFVIHMRVVIRRVWYRQQRTLRAQREVYDGGVAGERSTNNDRIDADVDRKRELETQRMLGERLRGRIGDDLDALRLFDLAMTRDLEPAELATELEWSPDKVRLVKKRIAYQARAVRQEWQDEEARRMEALRQATTAGSDAP